MSLYQLSYSTALKNCESKNILRVRLVMFAEEETVRVPLGMSNGMGRAARPAQISARAGHAGTAWAVLC